MNHSLLTSTHALPPFPSFPPSPSSSSSSPPPTPPLRFQPPTSAPHLYLHPDHLTASHSGPGHHSQDHTVLHTNLPLTFPPTPSNTDDDPSPSLAYFECQLLDAGKKGELFLGLINAASPAVDPQLLAHIRAPPKPHSSLHVLPLPPPAPAPASASVPVVYSSSQQRQLGSEHPLSVAVQLHTGRLFSVQLAVQQAKGMAFLPAFATGDTIGVGFVYAALTANTSPPSSSSSSSSSPSTLHPTTSSFSSSFPSSLLSLSSSPSSSAFSSPSLPPSSLSLSSYLFFTKNGRLIPDKEVSMDHVHLTPSFPLPSLSTPSPHSSQHAPPPPSPLYFPALSFHSPSESVRANFGASPFAFDLSTYAAELREREGKLRRDVEVDKQLLLPLIKEFLVWHAYDGTLAVLEESEGAELEAKARWKGVGGGGSEGGGVNRGGVGGKENEDDGLRGSVQVRGRIRQLIQASKVDDALALLRQHYPATLRRGAIVFALHSLTFIALLTSPHEGGGGGGGSAQAMAALGYAREHLWGGTGGRGGGLEGELLPKLMGLLALRKEEWEGNEWMGSEWREKVADRVNAEMVKLDRKKGERERGQVRGGEGQGGRGGGVEGQGVKRVGVGGGDVMKDDGDDGDGVMVKEEEGGGHREDGEEDEEGAPMSSAVELVMAQLLALDSVWRMQRPLLPHAALHEEDDQERAACWLEQR